MKIKCNVYTWPGLHALVSLSNCDCCTQGTIPVAVLAQKWPWKQLISENLTKKNVSMGHVPMQTPLAALSLHIQLLLSPLPPSKC